LSGVVFLPYVGPVFRPAGVNSLADHRTQPLLTTKLSKRQTPRKISGGFKFRIRNLVFATSLVLLAPSIPLHAQATCDIDALKGEQHDVATILRLENAWTVAYLKADTNFELCLLSKDLTEIVRSGDVKFLSDELAFARKNEGKNLPIPKLPKPTVLLHDNVAVAYGTSQSTGPDGKIKETRYADYYVWENGKWHAFFAQQTSLEK
jgi:hypothetical protein